MIEGELEGVEELMGKLSALVVEASSERSHELAYEVADILAEEIRKNIRTQGIIDSGETLESVGVRTVERSDTSIILDVGPSTPQAIYNEFGTSRMAARPFMRPALKSAEKRIEEHLADGFARKISEAIE